MTNRKRALLISISVILACVTVITGVTYALFTDKVNVNTHLSAGDLEVKLERTSLTYTELLTDGTFRQVVDSTPKDFTNCSDNVFGFDGTSLTIFPGSYYKVDMKVTNMGDVAFTHKAWVVINSEQNKTVDGTVHKLSDYILITITPEGGQPGAPKTLSEMASTPVSLGTVKLDDASTTAKENQMTFTVTVEFDERATSMLEHTSVNFDLFVEAVQVTND